MQVFQHGDPSSLTLRSHPWSGSLADAAHRHYDLRREPGLIRTALEDLRGWERYPAIETFYRLLESLNGDGSVLETNDCAFDGPTANEHADVAKALQCSGRVMLLFRELPHNTEPERVNAFTQAIAWALSREDEGFQWGVFGVTVAPVRFTALPSASQRGSQLMLSFWAWGDDAAEVMANLDRTLAGLTAALGGLLAWPD